MTTDQAAGHIGEYDMSDQLRNAYATTHCPPAGQSARLNQRLLDTYRTVAAHVARTELHGHNLDLGCGDGGFSAVCRQAGMESTGYDYPGLNLETAALPHPDRSIDFVTLNAVFEHLNEPGHILGEITRVLKPDGLLFIRTPNWQLDFINFYNDPTHRKPYTPKSLRTTLQLAGFSVLFLEPGLIKKSWWWWRLPESVKWRIASWLPGGTKSIIAMARPDNVKA